MLKRMLTSALIAGFAAGLLAALLHFTFVQQLILIGEQYETGEAVHYQGVAPADAGHPHNAAEPADHSHAASGDKAAPSSLTRNALTVLVSALVYVAYALVLVAGFGLLTLMGRTISPAEGILWGIGGFAAFQMAPALGLPPELPGTMAADLAARQVWWWGTALATATGLGLLAYGRGPALWAIAIALLAAPHLIGAPELDGFSGLAPPEVAAAFSARVLGVGLTVWAFMGGLAGWMWARSETTA